MSLEPYDGTITRSIKWQQNNAPNLQSLINQKSSWYSQYHDNFWSQWNVNVFDLRTANAFGLMIWCMILGVPSTLFGWYLNPRYWAYGSNRQNYVYSGTGSTTGENVLGGNFASASSTTVININEIRAALRIRYYMLISNGNTAFINAALYDVFGNFAPGNVWDFTNKQYFYVSDSTNVGPSTVVTQPNVIQYCVGANLGISENLINVLNNQANALMPRPSGVSYSVVRMP